MNKALGLVELARFLARPRPVDPGTQPASFTYKEGLAAPQTPEPHDPSGEDADEHTAQ